jgi:membrane-bound lytic murein transglycosylase B
MLLANGDTTRPIYGIPLDGRDGVAVVRDTDHGKLDGDPNFDRAVGPMQFIPSTWGTTTQTSMSTSYSPSPRATSTEISRR